MFKTVKGILHTAGKTEKEIREACNIGEVTQEDIQNQIKFYNLLDGMEADFIPHPAGEYAIICPTHEENFPRFKEAVYTLEQDRFFGCYNDDRERFDKDWDSGNYSSDGSICFKSSEVEITKEE